MFHATTTGRHRPTAWATLFAFGLVVAAVLYGSTGSTDNTAKRVLNPARTLDGGDPNTSRGRRLGLFKPNHDVPSFLRDHKSTLIPLFAPAPAIVVNSTAQSPGATGDCTLGEAIQAANSDQAVDGCNAGSGTDTIILPAGTYTLSSVDNDDHGFVGATGLPGINTDVIIQGDGRATTIIERDSNAALPFRLMAIKDQNVGSLVLNDLTMRGGRAGLGANGGALFTRGRPATLNRVDFIDNRVGIAGNPSQSSGGAVSGGTVIANDCTFTNNGSDDQCCGGGAIFASDITVRTSTFTGNTAGGGGGAIFTPGRNGQVNISDSVFLSNSGAAEGGAMLSQGTVTIARSTFDGNSTTTTAGALSVAGNVNISDCVIINNHADSDIGGVSNYTFTNGANVLSINRTNISDNTSGRNGGGIQIMGTSATISNSTISTNHANMNAGGLYDSSANLTLTNVTIEGNTAGNVNTAGDGGGMYCEDFIGTPGTTLNNVTIAGNQASRVGAGVFHHSGDLSLKNTIIALNNNGDTFGTDIYQKSVALTSLGYNLIGIKDGENFTNAIGDQTGDGANPINPQLGPLQSNGGPTLTRALLPGSPAIDAANPAAPGSGGDSCAGTDQRGRRRPDGILNSPGRCDIGAFEVAPPVVCATPPAGMVAWWRFEDNGNNFLGGSHISLFGNPAFVSGKVDQAVSFDGLDDYGQAPATGSIDVGSGAGLTLDLWINPGDNFTARPVIEWNNGAGVEGVQLWISADFAGNGQGPGSLFVNLKDTSGASHIISSAPGLLATNLWQHVAVTYDKSSGLAIIYLNGESVAQQTLGTFTPQTATDLFFGYRAVGVEAGRRYLGGMDQVELFDHALTPNEVETIYDADKAGTCLAPSIATIDITELILVSDTPALLPSAMIPVDEQIHVADTPALLPSAMIPVDEQIRVADTPAVLPSAMIPVDEQIHVADTPALLPSAMIPVEEQIHVADTPALLPSAMIPIEEIISVNDSVNTHGIQVIYATTLHIGITSIFPIDPFSLGSPPSGLTITGPAFDITTATTYTPPVSVCFSLPDVTDPNVFSRLRVLHGELNPLNQLTLVDRTSGLNFTDRTACAQVNSLSPFVIAEVQTSAAPPSTISGQVTTAGGAPLGGVSMLLSGGQSRFTLTDNQGRYAFENVESGNLYTVTPGLVNYTFSPANRSFSLLGNRTDAVFTALPDGTPTLNPLDTTGFFVRQHYLDFLNREPDEPGLNFWSNGIVACAQNASCVEVTRINTSAAFFLSIEFQQTGYEVYRLYKAAYDNLPGAPVPVRFNELLPDTQEISHGVIVNQPGWQQVLENNQQAFIAQFVQRPRFTSAYPGTMTPAEFVDRLFVNAGVPPSATDRPAAINEFGPASNTTDAPARARALRRVAENATLTQQEFNRAFVLMEYFGYLRRDPNQNPDTDFAGYNFWLSKLNQFNGNFENAEMVKAFINSTEYRRRFGP